MTLEKDERTQRQTQRYNIHRDRGRDWGDTVSNKRLGRGKEGLPASSFRRSVALLTPDSMLPASKIERINICCFKPPSLWYVVTAAIGN